MNKEFADKKRDTYRENNNCTKLDDELKGLENDIQKLTDAKIKEVDEAIDSKSTEIMTL